MDLSTDHDADDAALVRLLLTVVRGSGFVHIETEPEHPDLCPSDAAVYVDRAAPEAEQRAMLRAALTDVLVADLEYVGELAPLPRERMRLIPGGAQ